MRLFAAALLGTVCFVWLGAAHAAIRTWDANGVTPPNGSFNTAINWSSNTLPGAADTALFDLDAVYTVTFSGGATSDVLQVDLGEITFSSSNARTYNVLTDLLVRRSELTVSPNVTVNVGDEVDIGATLGNGTLTVSGTNARLNANGASGTHNIGGSGFDGILTYQSGAQGTIGGNLNVGVTPISSTMGDLNILSGAGLTVGNLRLGTTNDGGRGRIEVDGSGSTLTQSGTSILSVGSASGSQSVIDISNGGLFSTGTGNVIFNPTSDVFVGQTGGVGTFNANGNVTLDGGSIRVGASGAQSSFNLAPGKILTASNNSQIIFNAPTTLSDGTTWNFQSGADLDTATLSIGTSGIGTTTLTVDGSGSTVTQAGSSLLTVGHASAGTATINVTNGGKFTTSTGNITIRKTGTINVMNGAQFHALGAFSLDGATVNVVDGEFFTGVNHQFTAQNGAQVTVDGPASFLALFGPSLISNGADVSVSKNLDIPGFASVPTSIVIEGVESSVTSGAGLSRWGSDNAVDVTIRNGAQANVFDLELASGGVTMRIESGASMTVGALLMRSNGIATVTVTGAGSKFTHAGPGTLTIGHATQGTATINVLDGGSFSTGPTDFILSTTGTINLDGGTFNLNGPVADNRGTFNFVAGALNVAGDLSVGSSGLLPQSLSLTSDRALVVMGTTTIVPFRTLTVDGGAFSTGALTGNGTFDYRRGTLSITGANGMTIGSGGPLGAAVTLEPGQTLNVTNTATVQPGASLLLQTGGTFNAGMLANNGSITLDGVNSTLAGAVMNNAGMLRGDGRVTAAVNNLAAGEIRAEQGKTLRFTGASGPNNGRITLQGGSLQFGQPLTNAASGVISGRGTLFLDGGLTNAGKMQFSGGPTDIYGNVTFTGGAGGGEMINSGGANVVTLYGNVTHNGDEIRTSPGNTTVFFGDVTGAGPFTGTGAVRFEGTFSPGNSPGKVTIEGDAALAPGATLVMELSGAVTGIQYDQLHVGGLLALDGTLDVALLDGFAPAYGTTFDLFDFGSLAGQFDTVNFPALDGGLAWDTSALYSAGTIAAVPEPAGWLLALVALAALALRPLYFKVRR